MHDHVGAGDQFVPIGGGGPFVCVQPTVHIVRALADSIIGAFVAHHVGAEIGK